MRFLFMGILLFLVSTSVAQVRIDEVAGQINAGIGISNKPGTVFGTPFFCSADLSFFLSNQWRLSAEGGVTAFRDIDYPTEKIGLIFPGRSRYQHGYGGLLIGRNLLRRTQAGRLILLTGADYLSVIEPGVKATGGFLGGYAFHYLNKPYLNIPVQVDFSVDLFGTGFTKLSVNGRWNFNPYHNFPTISAGIAILFRNRHRKSLLNFDAGLP